MIRLAFWLVTVWTLTFSGLVFAAPGDPLQKSNGYYAVGTAIGGTYGECVVADDTLQVVRSTSSTDVPLCLPQGALLTAAARGGGVILCFSMTTGVTFAGTTDSRSKFEFTDANGPSGPASCIDLPAPGTMGEQRVDLAAYYTMPGARLGYCSATRNCMGVTSYIPCRIDGDCTAADAGSTCLTTASSCATLGLSTTCSDADKTANILNLLYNQGAAFAIMQAYDDGSCVSIRRER